MFARRISKKSSANKDSNLIDKEDNIRMQKTFINVSAALDDEVFKKLGWQAFQGSAKDFKELVGKIAHADGTIKEEYIGQQGYIKFAEEHYEGAMEKTFTNVSAVLDNKIFKKLRWQGFKGSSEMFQALPKKILNADGTIKEEYIGQQGQLKFATEHYGGDMQKTFINVSAVLDDEVFEKLGWQAFHGSSKMFQELPNKILNADGTIKEEYIGQQGQLKFAADYYEGAMHKTFLNVSAVLDDEVFKKLGWQGFNGSSEMFQELPNKILNADGTIKDEYIGQQGQLKFAADYYEGAMQKTFSNVSAVLDDKVFKKLGWQGFNGSSEMFQELPNKILNADGTIKDEYIGQQGQLKFAADYYEGAMQKTFSNVSAVLDDKVFKKLGWHYRSY